MKMIFQEGRSRLLKNGIRSKYTCIGPQYLYPECKCFNVKMPFQGGASVFVARMQGGPYENDIPDGHIKITTLKNYGPPMGDLSMWQSSIGLQRHSGPPVRGQVCGSLESKYVAAGMPSFDILV